MTTSSMTMEVMAVTQAFMWLESHDYSRVCVLSDSLSMIRRVEAGWFDSLQNCPVRAVTFILVLGYADVVGNERADRLAGAALIEDDGSMDHADIVIVHREIGRYEDFGSNVSIPSLRIRELEAKTGTAEHEKHTGLTRSLVNQYRTGTINRAMLMNILRGQSDHQVLRRQSNS